MHVERRWAVLLPQQDQALVLDLEGFALRLGHALGRLRLDAQPAEAPLIRSAPVDVQLLSTLELYAAGHDVGHGAQQGNLTAEGLTQTIGSEPQGLALVEAVLDDGYDGRVCGAVVVLLHGGSPYLVGLLVPALSPG